MRSQTEKRLSSYFVNGVANEVDLYIRYGLRLPTNATFWIGRTLSIAWAGMIDCRARN